MGGQVRLGEEKGQEEGMTMQRRANCTRHAHTRKDDRFVEGREKGRKRGERPLLKAK